MSNMFIEIADLLEKCASGQIDARDALQVIEKTSIPINHKVLNDAIHHLHHFCIDEDIRERDQQYDRSQRDKLIAWAGKVRSLAETY